MKHQNSNGKHNKLTGHQEDSVLDSVIMEQPECMTLLNTTNTGLLFCASWFSRRLVELCCNYGYYKLSFSARVKSLHEDRLAALELALDTDPQRREYIALLKDLKYLKQTLVSLQDGLNRLHACCERSFMRSFHNSLTEIDMKQNLFNAYEQECVKQIETDHNKLYSVHFAKWYPIEKQYTSLFDQLFPLVNSYLFPCEKNNKSVYLDELRTEIITVIDRHCPGIDIEVDIIDAFGIQPSPKTRDHSFPIIQSITLQDAILQVVLKALQSEKRWSKIMSMKDASIGCKVSVRQVSYYVKKHPKSRRGNGQRFQFDTTHLFFMPLKNFNIEAPRTSKKTK